MLKYMQQLHLKKQHGICDEQLNDVERTELCPIDYVPR